MAAVPGGPFLMGSDDPDADADERPPALVSVEAFWIDRVEVTNARYDACVQAGACTLPAGPALGDATKADHPVTIVSWAQADAYCRWAGKRLPTEAEWEKAARGEDGRRYPWGSEFEPERLNAGYTAGTAAVGSHAAGASTHGVLDLAGNVWEWTASLYRPYPYDPGDGREDPAARGARVNRGGSWYYGAWYARTTYRATADHIYRRIADLGFRCARSAAPLRAASPARWPPGRVVPFWIQKERARERNRELVRLALANWQEASAGRLRFEESEAFEAATLRVFFAGYYPDFGTAKPQVDLASGEIRRADVIVVSDPLGDRLQRDLVVYLTALHELGHALGLPHSERRGEIMYGFHGPEDAEWTFENYRGKLRSLEDIGKDRANGITEEDRRALAALYASERPSSR
jgi:hypothetical protein